MSSDLELLRNYTRNKSEESFSALVNRHLNLVYSAAFRQVRSPQLAEDVVQATFIDLAHQAHGLAPNTILTAWLYQVSRRTAINLVRREARRQTREQAACEFTAVNATANDWTDVEALLDEAMHALDETDRTAVLLRYFENKSLREVGQVLGTSENAAQKRICRAVERLREFFARRGVAIGANGLAVAISAKAVQAAPIGLAATISSAAIVSGTTLASSATTSFFKALTMTTPQKTFIAATFILAVGTGVFETHKASSIEAQIQTLQRRQAFLDGQIQRLRHERDAAVEQLTALRADNERLNGISPELLKLRGEVGILRGLQAIHEQGANVPSQRAEATAVNGPSPEEIGRELGIAVVQGDPGAFGKMLELAKVEHASFNTDKAGLNDSQRGDLGRQTFAPLHAAFGVIAEAAVGGNHVAVDAVVQSMQIPELKGDAVQCLGAIAGNGNRAALEILLNPREYDLLLSGAVGALQPAADNGNQKAIEGLAAVASDAGRSPLWYMAAKGLEKSAASGNAVAVDALIGLSASTNISVRNVVITGLKAAAANQNAKAAEALRSIGIE